MKKPQQPPTVSTTAADSDVDALLDALVEADRAAKAIGYPLELQTHIDALLNEVGRRARREIL